MKEQNKSFANQDKTQSGNSDLQNKESSESTIFQKILAFVQLIAILLIIIVIPAYIMLERPDLIDNFKSVDAFQALMQRYHDQSMVIYLVCQIMQIIITIIPGQIIQISGGYLFGFFIALILSVSGVFIGSSISFGIARVLGKKPLQLIFGEKRFERYNSMLDTKKAHIVIFVLYLIPGFPKDMIAYIAGVSNMRYLSFTIISLLGRLPSMSASLLMGTMLKTESYVGAAILAAIVLFICLMCIIKKNKLMQFVNKYYDKLNNSAK